MPDSFPTPDRFVPPHSRQPRVALLGSASRRPDMLNQIQALRPIVEQYASIVFEDWDGKENWTGDDIDFCVVFGGDGSILRAARQMGTQQRPVLGVNLGRLGFLADIMPSQLPAALRQVTQGFSTIVSHLMIQCSLVRDERVLSEHLGLNEVAIRGAAPFNMQLIDLYVDGQLATSYNCDGLIISTPVGSTAHNLSAGGPILRKDLRAFVISPISPHTLTVRPIVDTAERVFEMVINADDCSATVVMDGQPIHDLRTADIVRVKQANPEFQLLETAGHWYYSTLREKLGWSGDLFRHRGPVDS